MDETCQIGGPYSVNEFLCGLGPDYEVFLTAFNQNYNILLIRDLNNGNVILKEAVTFETAILAASQEADKRRGVTARIAHRAMLAQDTPDCGHCGRKNIISVCARNFIHSERSMKRRITRDNEKCKDGRRRRRMMYRNVLRLRLLHTSNSNKFSWLFDKMVSNVILD